MFSFTSLLLTVFGLFFLQSANCVVLDSHPQLYHFVRQTPAESKKLTKDEKLSEEKKLTNDKKAPKEVKPPSIRPIRERRKSRYNLLDSMYTEYKFNWHFKSFSLQDASSERYSEVKDSYKPLIDDILDENQLPVLASGSGKTWKVLNESFVESYENERGVIVYDQDFFRWVYCGWLTLDSDNLRICAPLLPLGLEDIERDAVKDSDYIPKDTAMYLHGYAGNLSPLGSIPDSESEKSTTSELGMLAGIRKNLSKLLTVREDFLLVDLFVDTANTYDQNCLDNNADQSDCAPICCYSTYIGSSFCTEQPMNCIYFGG